MTLRSKVAVAFAALVTLTRVVSLLAALVYLNFAAWKWDSSYIPPAVLLLALYVGSSWLMFRMLSPAMRDYISKVKA